ncbi:MAG: hypothetical protein HFI86_02575 [Bacilli bacterium]|nr:hypothetical protein [Bacilli bacterium]
MIQDIVKINEERISEDLNEINGIQGIDFIDIFSTSEEHRKTLDEEACKLAKLVDSTEKDNFYLLNNPIKTRWGNLRFFKIRFYDESRLNYEAAPDFKIENWDKLKKIGANDKRFSFIDREKWQAIEFKTNNCLVYFLNPLVTTVYGIED